MGSAGRSCPQQKYGIESDIGDLALLVPATMVCNVPSPHVQVAGFGRLQQTSPMWFCFMYSSL